MILENNDIISTSGGIIYENTSGLSLVHNFTTFPVNTSLGSLKVISFTFTQATTMTIYWGDGTNNTYSTRLSSGKYIIDIQVGTGSDPLASRTTAKTYGSSGTKVVKFLYEKELLQEIRMSNIALGIEQSLIFSFSAHSNLKVFNLQNLKKTTSSETIIDGAITQLNMLELEDSIIEEFDAIQLFATSNIYYGRIPSAVFSLPLKVLQISGNHQASLGTSNIDRIAEFTQLETLTLRIPFTQSQGFPVDLTNLIPTLKTLNFNVIQFAFAWTSLPLNIRTLSSLELLNLDFNIKSSFSISSTFFSTMTSLKELNINSLNRGISDWSFIASLPTTFENLQCLGNNNTTRLNASIMACFNWVKNNSLSGKIFAFESRSGTIANIPSGTYAEPLDHANPASALEAIWVLRNDYGCTVTYRAV